MSDRIYMDRGSMAAGQEAISAAELHLRGLADDVRTATGRLTWAGADAVGFQGYQKAWDGIFADTLDMLLKLRGLVGLSAENSEITEKQNADMFAT